jgi:hypothetical protein
VYNGDLATKGGQLKISIARVLYDLDFRIFGTFSIISQKGIIVVEKSRSKTYGESTSPGIDVS